MTPKQLIVKLQAEATDEIGKARLEGALIIHEAYLDRQRKYYATHKEHNKLYQREYQRNRYRKAHGLPIEEK